MKIWEKNIKALSYKNQTLADEIKRVILQNEIRRVQAKELENGERVLTVEKDGHTWYLNSRLDPGGASDLYAKRYPVKPFYRYFLFGMSDGRVIRNLYEQCGESNALIICEPDKEIMAAAFLQYDLEEMLLDGRVWFCLSDIWSDICNAVFEMVDYAYRKLVEFCILPGYDVLYPEECKKFMDEVIEKLQFDMIYRNSFLDFDRVIPRNILFHMRNMIFQRNIAQVKQLIEKENARAMPAILIAAGPSLDKNIKEVKKAEGKAFVIAVDAALRTVIREGIRPDLVCTVDPRSPKRFSETESDHELLWACIAWTNRDMVKKSDEKVFYFNSIIPWWDDIIKEELSYEFPKIDTGNCVSAVAFELAKYLGFQTIIFIGQDLAFTGGQSHTKGIEGVLGSNDEYIKSRNLVWVKDENGEPILTDYQMNLYREWFEKEIRQSKDELRVINATEGGAKMEGAYVCTLKEALETECVKQTDLYQKIREIPPAFSAPARERLLGRLAELNEIKEDFKQKVEHEIALGQALKEEADTLNPNEAALRLREFADWNEQIEKHPFLDWIMMYAFESEFDLKEDILAKENMQIGEMMERSIRLLMAYQSGIPLFEEDMEETFIKP